MTGEDHPEGDRTRDGSGSAVMAVEGGGSRTRGALARDGVVLIRRDGPSINPQSVGPALGTASLLAICQDLWRGRPTELNGVDIMCICVASAPTVDELSALVDDLTATALPGRPRELWVANDMLPVVCYPDGPTAVAVICGTGTSFAARAPQAWARASGLEWILSDEGGGTDLGMRGLRAIVRAADGRGPTTQLTAMAEEWHSDDPPRVLRHVHGHNYPKPVVASFAPYVLAAAAEGDRVADGLVSDSAQELMDGCAAVIMRSGIADEAFPIVMSGSLLVEASSPLRLKLLARLADTYPKASLSTILDPLDAVVRLTRRIRADPQAVASASYAIPVMKRVLTYGQE